MHANQTHAEAFNHARNLARIAGQLSPALGDSTRFTERQLAEVVRLINQAQVELNRVRAPIRKAASPKAHWVTDNLHVDKPNMWGAALLCLELELLIVIVYLLR